MQGLGPVPAFPALCPGSAELGALRGRLLAPGGPGGSASQGHEVAGGLNLKLSRLFTLQPATTSFSSLLPGPWEPFILSVPWKQSDPAQHLLLPFGL